MLLMTYANGVKLLELATVLINDYDTCRARTIFLLADKHTAKIGKNLFASP